MITNTSIVAPDTLNEIVSLATAKQQLRLEADFDFDDDLIEGYIQSAIEISEQYINGHIQFKSLVINLDAFPASLEFSEYPIQAIDSVTYYNNSGLVTMPTSDYYLSAVTPKKAKITFKEQPNTDERPDAVIVTATIGFTGTATVPTPIKQAILLQISDMYERREDRPEVVTTAAQALMRPYRKYS